MDIRNALDRVIAVQGAMSISSPASIAALRAYKYVPARDSALPDTPCWFNSWSFVREERLIQLRRSFYSVRMQLAVHDADLDRAADIATAFHVAAVADFSADVTLNGQVTNTEFRGGSPTLVRLDWAGMTYVGLDLFLDLVMEEAVTFAL